MKKFLGTMLMMLLCMISNIYALGGLSTSTIYNNDASRVLSDEFVSEGSNPLRKGINGAISTEGGDSTGVPGVRKPGEIQNFDEAKESTMDVINKFINYALGLVSLVAFVYLIVHGFMIMTAMDDDEKAKKGMKGIQTAAIALGGIAVSRLIVSLVFYIINMITTGTS